MSKKTIFALISIGLFFLILLLPASVFYMPGLTVLEQRVIAIFVLAACCWVLEPIPIFATSVLVIVLELLLLSDKGLVLFAGAEDAAAFGARLNHQDIMATFASPVIMLFLGGFFLAIAATKYRLDLNLARVMLKPFGNKPHKILLGLMCITGIFSMFMSNTATTAMMLSILAPVLASLPDGDRGRTAFALAIPIAANIGGIGTPIGTPPNALALKYIIAFYPISFGEWMLFGVPFVLVLMFVGWWLLRQFFPISVTTINLNIQSSFIKSWRAGVVYFTFALTVILWMFGGQVGLNAYVVAMIPVAVFTCTGIISSKDLKTISWDVLWLISGGIALGLALEKTGLAYRIVTSIPFGMFAPFTILCLVMLITFAMANFMSHTSTANLLLPVIAALATGISGFAGFGGSVGLLLAVTFASSLGMTLPISTPPNALASATGMITTKNMAKTGLIIGVIGLILTVVMLCCISLTGIT